MDREALIAWMLVCGFEPYAWGGYNYKAGPYCITVGTANKVMVKVQDMEVDKIRWKTIFRYFYKTDRAAYRRILHYIELGEAGGSQNFKGAVTTQGLLAQH